MPQQHLYFIGLDHPTVAGIAMAVKTLGFIVSGSAVQLDQLTKQQLAQAGIHHHPNYQAQHIDPDSLIVVAPHIAKDNPELKMAQKLKLEIASVAQLIQQISQNQQQIVVIGSSTTAALIASLLDTSDYAADIVASQQINSTNHWPNISAVHFAAKPWLVIDGQSRAASILDKATQWLYYQPRFIILTQSPTKRTTAFYKDLHHLCAHAKELPQSSIKPTLIAPDTDKQSAQVAQQTGLRYISYGQTSAADCQVTKVTVSDSQTAFDLHYKKDRLAIKTNSLGHQAVADYSAALSLACVLGLDHQTVLTSLGNFNGLYRNNHIYASDHNLHLVEMSRPWAKDVDLVLNHLRQQYIMDSTSHVWLVDKTSGDSIEMIDSPAIDIYLTITDLSQKLPQPSAKISSKTHYVMSLAQATHFIAQHIQPGDVVCYINSDEPSIDFLTHIEAALHARLDQS